MLERGFQMAKDHFLKEKNDRELDLTEEEKKNYRRREAI